jgi:hypothetical protein
MLMPNAFARHIASQLMQIQSDAQPLLAGNARFVRSVHFAASSRTSLSPLQLPLKHTNAPTTHIT